MGIRKPGRKRRNGRAAFRAVELEVRAALSAGWTVVAIYEEKQLRLGMSYAQFARYVQPLREALKARALAPSAAFVPATMTVVEPAATTALERRRPQVMRASGPPKGRPEDAIPQAQMDDFATKALKNRDLF